MCLNGFCPGVPKRARAGRLVVAAEIVKAAEHVEEKLPVNVGYLRRILRHRQGIIDDPWV